MLAISTQGVQPVAHIEVKAGNTELVIAGQRVPLPFRPYDHTLEIGHGLTLSTILHVGNRPSDFTSKLLLLKEGKTIAHLDLCAEFDKWVKHNWGGRRFTAKFRNSDELIQELPVVYQAMPLPSGKVLAVVGYEQYALVLGDKRADLVLLNLNPFKMQYLKNLSWASYNFSGLTDFKSRLHRFDNSNLLLIGSNLFFLKEDGRVGKMATAIGGDIYGIVNGHWLISQTASEDYKSALVRATNLQTMEGETLCKLSRDIYMQVQSLQWDQRSTKSAYFCVTLDYSGINMRRGPGSNLRREFLAINPATKTRIWLPEAVLCAGTYGVGIDALTGKSTKALSIYDLRSGRLVQTLPWR